MILTNLSKELSNRYDGINRSDEQELRIARSIARFSGIGLDKAASGLTVTLNIKNTGSAAKTICLFPGDLKDVDEIKKVVGKEVDGIAGTTIADVEVTSNQCIPYIQRFVARNPTSIISASLSVDNEAQLSHAIEFTQSSPFRSLGSQLVVPKSHQKSGDANTKLVEVPFVTTQLDDQTQMMVTVGAGRSMEITLFMGASANIAQGFAETADFLLA